jgi:hypothetical protein
MTIVADQTKEQPEIYIAGESIIVLSLVIILSHGDNNAASAQRAIKLKSKQYRQFGT